MWVAETQFPKLNNNPKASQNARADKLSNLFRQCASESCVCAISQWNDMILYRLQKIITPGGCTYEREKKNLSGFIISKCCSSVLECNYPKKRQILRAECENLHTELLKVLGKDQIGWVHLQEQRKPRGEGPFCLIKAYYRLRKRVDSSLCSSPSWYYSLDQSHLFLFVPPGRKFYRDINNWCLY